MLEAIHVLGLGRSFRSRQHRRLIRDECDALTVFARGLRAEQPFSLGLRQSDQKDGEIRLNGSHRLTRAELPVYLPLLLIEPTTLDVLSGPSEPRRQLLDWLTFHRCPEFMPAWRAARQALAQRNSLLKSGRLSRSEFAYWEDQLARASASLDRFRADTCATWQAAFLALVPTLLPTTDLSVDYHRGWASDDLVQAYADHRDRDRARGFTQEGPHRADLRMKAAGWPVMDRLSRGQQKLTVMALLLSAVQVLQQHQILPVLLLDDVAAELDADARQRVLAVLSALPVQVLLTALDDAWLPNRPDKDHVFYVSSGTVSPRAPC